MGTNSFTTIGTSSPVDATGDLVDQYGQALNVDLVPRNASGVPTTGAGDLGTDAYKWKDIKWSGIAYGDGSGLTNISNTNFSFDCQLNFSIDQKEDTEDSEYDNQIKAQTIPYGSKFTSVTADSERLHRLEVVNVPAASHEVTYTGSWSNNDTSNYLFGRGKVSSTVGDTAVFDFVGVGIGVNLNSSTSQGFCTAELSSDGGVTYSKKITVVQKSGASVYNLIYPLYSGLTFGSYRVKMTVIKTSMEIGFFSYQTYMVQKPITQYEVYNASYATTVDMVPPTTSFLTGTWGAVNRSDTGLWNSTDMMCTNVDGKMEFKFYGKYLWINAVWEATADVAVTVTIDGVSTHVKASSINLDTPYNYVPAWIRLDDGQLTDGVHTCELNIDTVTSGEFQICGWGWYSAKADSTLCHDLILGESSYVVGVDDAGFGFTGAGWDAISDSGLFLFRRYKTSNNNGDYFTFTTPNNSNLKAIYLVIAQSTDRGRIKTTIGSSDTRYLNMDTNNYSLYDTIVQLYDSTVDGITLHNKQLKVEKIDGTYQSYSGLIFEIWGTDKIGTNSIKVMQKWSRYNASTNLNTPVSNSYRFSVSGLGKTGQDALPVIHSGWCYGAGNVNTVWDMGVMRDEVFMANVTLYDGVATAPINQVSTTSFNNNSSVYGLNLFGIRPEILYKYSNGSDTSALWLKLSAQLKRVI